METVAERIKDIAQSIKNTLHKKIQSFVAFSIAVDESTGITDTSQLAIFIRGVDSDMNISEEMLDVMPISGTTTENDLYLCISKSFENANVDWSKLVSVTTDRAPAMVGISVGLVKKL